MQEKYGFVYIWFDSKRKMYYIGSHWGLVEDRYICSSNRMRDAYRRRPNDFKRRIISKIYTSKIDLLNEEHRWLSKIKQEELGKKYYNLRNQMFNHWTSNDSKYTAVKEKIKNKLKSRMESLTKEERSKIYGKSKPTAEETKRKLSEAMKIKIANGFKPTCGIKGKQQSEKQKAAVRNAMTGRIVSEKTRKKISEFWKNKTKEEKQKIWSKRRKMTKEEKEHLSSINKGKKHSEQTKEKIREIQKRRWDKIKSIEAGS